MFAVQIPLQRVDNSFDYNDSKLVRSVDSDNLQGKGKFNEVFESASSEFKKMQKSDVEKKIKPAAEKTKKNEINSDKSTDSKKQLKKKDVKLVIPGKIVTDNLKVRLKKKENSENLKVNITDISAKAPGVKEDSKQKEDLISDNYSDAVVLNPEAVEKSAESSIIPIELSFSKDSVETGISVEFSDSVLLKNVGAEKKNSAGKKNTIKKETGIKKGKISVFDLRQAETKRTRIKQTDLNAGREGQKFSVGSSDQLNIESDQESKPIVIELTHVKDNFSSESKTLTTASSSSLMKQLEENINNKIVKQSSVILKDGGSGEIKLILKPEQLGRVRIRLNLTDNKLTGQIIVESLAVKEVFEQNLQNLERAFKDSGFDTAALNVSVGGDHSGNREREPGSDISKQIELIDEIIPTMISDTEYLIDLVV